MTPHETQLEIENPAFIQRLQDKEQGAWAMLICCYKPYLQTVIRHSLAKYMLTDDHLDDIEQKTWITAHEKIDVFQLKQKGGLLHWLCAIERNHVRNLKREPSHLSIDSLENEHEDNLIVDQPDRNENVRSVENEVISRERKRELLSALDLVLEDLSQPRREIVLRRLIFKDDVSDLAQEYHLSPDVVSQIVWNAKKKLSNYLLAPDLFFRVQNNKTGEAAKKWTQ